MTGGRRAELAALRREYARSRVLVMFVGLHALPFVATHFPGGRLGALAVVVAVDLAIVKFADRRVIANRRLAERGMPAPIQEACRVAGLAPGPMSPRAPHASELSPDDHIANTTAWWHGSLRDRELELSFVTANVGAPRALLIAATPVHTTQSIATQFEWCPIADWHGVMPAPSDDETDVWAEFAVEGLVFRSTRSWLAASVPNPSGADVRPLLLTLAQAADQLEAASPAS